jgi:hypothetical protein
MDDASNILQFGSDNQLGDVSDGPPQSCLKIVVEESPRPENAPSEEV